jgi:drug/metabolite transporter (DMT)-like permease
MELSVGHLILYRFIFASIAFAPAVWMSMRRPETRVARQDYATLSIAALIGIPVQFLIQFYGLARTTVSHASLMIGVLPVLLAAGSALFLHERVTRARWVALVASTLGAALIAFGASSGEAGAQASLAGDLLVALSLVTAVIWILMTQELMKSGRYTPVSASAYIIVLGTIMLAIWIGGTEGLPPVHLSARTWMSVIIQGIAATTMPTWLWNWGLARVPASQAGVFLNLEPVVGSILGVVILGDLLGPYALVGGLLVIVSAVYVAAK